MSQDAINMSEVIADQNAQPPTFSMDELKSFIASDPGTKVEVNGVMIYHLKVGTGNHPVLCFPGTTGTIASDFYQQVKDGGFDREKFTLVIMEPRGSGHSRPPDRTEINDEMWVTDATDAVSLMKNLGFDKFSFIGWCAGGNVGITADALFPDNIISLVIWGAYPMISERAYCQTKKMGETKEWDPKLFETKGLEYPDPFYVINIFQRLAKYKMQIYEERGGDCIMKYLSQIKCPVLYLHLKLDFFVDQTQMEVIAKNVGDVTIHEEEEGKHAFHQRYPMKFKSIVESFYNSKGISDF